VSKVAVSVVIPVKNEAVNLPRCLAAVAWADEIWVVDSKSADATCEIATTAGAKVVQFEFNGTWPKKKNWALENLSFANEWVLLLDADEVMPVGVGEEIRKVVSESGGHDGYWINRRFNFLGIWLRHAYYPNWNLRLFRHKLGRFEKLTEAATDSGDMEVHEHVVVKGKTSRLKSEMDHYAFPTVAAFMEKHNRYSNWEAHVAVEGMQNGTQLQHAGPGARRSLRRLSLKLPFRPLLRFLYVYIWQRGFLDGRAGYYFARLHATYELLCVTKTYELKLKMGGDNGGGNLSRKS